MKIVKPKERANLELARKFRKIYRIYIKPVVRRYLKGDNCYLPIFYTVNSGRNRFMSGLAFIISPTPIGAAIGAVAEIMWGVVLIYDDLGDKSEFRRGKLAAWKKFGPLYALHSAGLGLLLAKKILRDYKAPPVIIDLLKENFTLTMRSQITQSLLSPYSPLKAIIENYLEKGALSRWSVEVSLFVSQKFSRREKNAINKISLNLSITGQIKNDISDFLYEPETGLCMRDVKEKIPTYPTVLFMNRAGRKDKQFFIREIWGNNCEPVSVLQKKCLKIFEKWDIIKLSKKRIEELAKESLSYCGNISDSEIKKDLIRWINSSLKI